jgi:hypothetical protein
LVAPPSALPYLILNPLGEHEEKKLIGAILDAVAGQNGLSLDRNLLLERGMATPVNYEVTGRIIVVGASHMYRMAEYLPKECVGIASF